jgi:PAS domain S-box-containing protein
VARRVSFGGELAVRLAENRLSGIRSLSVQEEKQMDTIRLPEAENAAVIKFLQQRLASLEQQIAQTEAKYQLLRQNQKSVAASEEWLRLAMDSAMLGPWDWDLATGNMSWSPVHNSLLGLPAEQRHGNYEQFLDRIFPEDRDRVSIALRAALDDKLPFVCQFRAFDEAGGYRWIHAHGKAFYDSEGNPVRLVGVIADVSARKEIEEQLLELEGQRSQIQEAERMFWQRENSRPVSPEGSDEEPPPLAACLMTAQDDERKRIARELHDNIGQRLAVLAIDLESLPRKSHDLQDTLAQLPKLHGNLNTVIEELHQLSHRLHPSILDQVGLVPALQELCEDCQARREQEIHFSSSNFAAPIPVEISSVVYRITQEALHNAIKYAPNSRVFVRLVEAETGLQLSIEDEGPGFETARLRTGKAGLGVISMQERARLAGGVFSISSRPGAGTHIRFSVALPLASSVAFHCEESETEYWL